MPDEYGNDTPSDNCRVCGRDTNVIVNINLHAAKVCDSCCSAITKQTVVFWARLNEPEADDD